MTFPQRIRKFWPVVGIWMLVNIAIYFGLEGLDFSKRFRQISPSKTALRLFKPVSLEHGGSGKDDVRKVSARFLSPPSVNPVSRYPLLVFLHGSGQCGDDNDRQLTGLPEQMSESAWRNRLPCFLLAPQCPRRSGWSVHDDELIRLIKRIVDSYPIDSRRIYLTGLSMGGYGCWNLAARHPALFAAVVPICGGGSVDDAVELVDVPIWAVHGAADAIVPAEESRMMVRAIEAAGGRKIRYTELAGVGHDCWTQTYRKPDGVLAWMFQQVRDRRELTP